jgi:FKBP-type peptidyl-prolyl cis-trans isomerase FkpA
MKKYLFLLLCCFTLINCSKDDVPSIEEFIKNKGLTTSVTDEGLHYVIVKPGNQLKKPKVNSTVRVQYKGTLLNDKQFDSSTDSKFSLSNLIAGWRRGLPLIGEGGEIKLIIPPYLGYGDVKSGDIPANSDLYFEITLLEVFD